MSEMTRTNEEVLLDKLQQLVKLWRKEADQYQVQVEEARRKGTEHQGMLGLHLMLRNCAKQVEALYA